MDKSQDPSLILQIALDTPLRRVFDYLPPRDVPPDAIPPPGIRVSVPFGRRRLIGVLIRRVEGSTVPPAKLRTALELLDAQSLFDPVTFELLCWAADYYHHPIGEVFAAALPAPLRLGQSPHATQRVWTLTPAGRAELAVPTDRRAPRRRALLTWMAARAQTTDVEAVAQFSSALLKATAQRGWIAHHLEPAGLSPVSSQQTASSEVVLTDEQAATVAAVGASLGSFTAHLLYGVTGSGKTEVYLRAIERATLDRGQVLVLVPEIGLTPQLVERFRRRFGGGVAVVHSGLTDLERRDSWRAAHSGAASIVIGTRSAVFTSLPNLRLIVVDEEHDASFKQHEGFRYSARDLSVLRAQRANVPIILGSATPSLETLENAAQGRYLKHILARRAGAAQPPHMALVDLRKHAAEQGLSQPALSAIARHLEAGGQIIVFLNRRGYAPCLFCNRCGWIAPCEHCDARMTYHRRAAQLRCHHCGAQHAAPLVCGACGHALHAVGQGTERVEETLNRFFPTASLARLDRDTAAPKGAMQALLEQVQSGAARILVGTQMLTKGHHFPDVSLVLILDADQGLFASDFRASERLAQTITQVAGRAGRETRAGEVLIQTQFPEHPLLTRLISEGYDGFAASALEERRAAQWPPFTRLAMLRGEAKDRIGLDEFLRSAGRAAQPLLGAHSPGVKVMGPATAAMARRADHFRAHLLIESAQRHLLHRFLSLWLPRVDSLSGPTGLRWSIDVDPLEVD